MSQGRIDDEQPACCLCHVIVCLEDKTSRWLVLPLMTRQRGGDGRESPHDKQKLCLLSSPPIVKEPKLSQVACSLVDDRVAGVGGKALSDGEASQESRFVKGGEDEG